MPRTGPRPASAAPCASDLGLEPGADLGPRHSYVARLMGSRRQLCAQFLGGTLALLAREALRVRGGGNPLDPGRDGRLRADHGGADSDGVLRSAARAAIAPTGGGA
ncbi:protein of unknown function (plasmid) [Cupriavidus taiwanensis]|uniref:Uncharacterized protein n=1 Tax=Cupriavidus taiwanensis TaxID=164546 RepID=A0A375HE59_9BURK|nr:protein of unknown function [Cupriavidus taiwanensis]SOZ72372.1 protein of unknown function [Cupriavidus taiwanensis]SOZ74702.1 protein of unknown function [Cupriavidus taiwanensis]SPA03577.1 protein of unknown function [Cupriavidus taiwanensis]SPA11476.1 protein of unknown function [Cupriavidus taiwanensis]